MMGDAEAKCAKLQKNHGLEKTSTLYLMILTFSLALGAVQLACLSCEEGTPKITV